MLKVSVSQQFLSTSALWLLPVVLLSPSLVLSPYKLPAKPSSSAFCQVHTAAYRLCFNGLPLFAFCSQSFVLFNRG